jgi:acetyl esterase/lipase
MKIISLTEPRKYYVELVTDIVFSRTEDGKLFENFKQLKLDLLLPQCDEQLPLIVFIQGGAWMNQNRSKNLPQLVAFAQKGYVVASIEHRLSHEAVFPVQLYDVKTAVRYLRAHATTYGIDPNRIAAWGMSSGGHLAALLGVTGHLSNLEGMGEWMGYSSEVQAVIDFYGPSDVRLFEGLSAATPGSRLLGEQVHSDKASIMSPITYISDDAPPFLIIHGDSDGVVPLQQSELFYSALKDVGADVEFYKLKGAEHNFSQFCIQSDSLEIVASFLKSKM